MAWLYFSVNLRPDSNAISAVGVVQVLDVSHVRRSNDLAVLPHDSHRLSHIPGVIWNDDVKVERQARATRKSNKTTMTMYGHSPPDARH